MGEGREGLMVERGRGVKVCEGTRRGANGEGGGGWERGERG